MINEIQPKIKFQNIVQCPFNYRSFNSLLPQMNWGIGDTLDWGPSGNKPAPSPPHPTPSSICRSRTKNKRWQGSSKISEETNLSRCPSRGVHGHLYKVLVLNLEGLRCVWGGGGTRLLIPWVGSHIDMIMIIIIISICIPQHLLPQDTKCCCLLLRCQENQGCYWPSAYPISTKDCIFPMTDTSLMHQVKKAIETTYLAQGHKHIVTSGAWIPGLLWSRVLHCSTGPYAL